jgi:apolipoprotein N-acyltransferase
VARRRSGGVRFVLPLGAACVAGGLLATAGPPTNLYPALWIGMAALAALVNESSRPTKGHRGSHSLGRVAALGLAFGTGANIVAFRFVPLVITRFTSASPVLAVVALVLLALEQSLRWGTATTVHAALARRGTPSPLAFAMGIFAGSFVPAVFPWTPAGGITPIPALVQSAEVIGERGVTVLIALSAGLLAEATRAHRLTLNRRGWITFVGAAIAIPLLTLMSGQARIRALESARKLATTARVALVQPSTNALERWAPERAPAILASLTEATARAERERVELTVWPEGAYPYLVGHRTRRCPIGPVAMLPFGVRGPVLSGLVMTGANGDTWNSAAVCRTDGTLEPPQDKVHLLWFGETIPWLDRIPWVRSTFTRGTGLIAGDGVVVQHAGRVRASVLNCFEDILPGAGREAMSAAPNLLVNVTNDAWFGGTQESELHLRLAALRAVESRRDLVRAVNGGVTSWVDAAGVVRARRSGDAPGTLIVDAALLENGPTFFDRFGDVPLAALLVGAALLATRKGAHKVEKAQLVL